MNGEVVYQPESELPRSSGLTQFVMDTLKSCSPAELRFLKEHCCSVNTYQLPDGGAADLCSDCVNAQTHGFQDLGPKIGHKVGKCAGARHIEDGNGLGEFL
jgi:hypothetical protein